MLFDNGAAVGESIGGSDPWTPDDLTNLVNAATWPSSAGASLAIDTPDGQYFYSSAIANPTPDPAYPLGLLKLGPGTLHLSGSDSYSGSTEIEAGDLEFDTASALTTGGITIDSGGAERPQRG